MTNEKDQRRMETFKDSVLAGGIGLFLITVASFAITMMKWFGVT